MMDLWMIQNIAPLFYRVMELSIAAVCIGLGVLLLRKVADKRIPPIWKNALWLLVLVALVVPYRPSSNVAVIPTTEVNFRQQENSLHTEITQEKTELNGNYQVPVELTTQREDLHVKSLVFEVVIPGIWLLGMAMMMGILLATRQKMGKNLRMPNGRPYDLLLADCKRQLGITQSVEIVEQSYLKTPALYGLLRPKILLPHYVAEMSENSQRYIILHELCHLKHGDLIKNTLLLALQVVYWCNPLVWLLFRFIRQDMELLNDQRVLKTLEKSEETPYATSLIQVLGHSKKLPLAPQMLCMVDNKGNTKRRIQMIQLGEVFKKHKIIIAVGCLVVIGVLSALFLTAQPKDATITPGTYYGPSLESDNTSLEIQPMLFVGKYGTVTLYSSFAIFDQPYDIVGDQLQFNYNDVNYIFRIDANTLVLDLDACQDAFFSGVDIPGGVVFTLQNSDDEMNSMEETSIIGGAAGPTEIEVDTGEETITQSVNVFCRINDQKQVQVALGDLHTDTEDTLDWENGESDVLCAIQNLGNLDSVVTFVNLKNQDWEITDSIVHGLLPYLPNNAKIRYLQDYASFDPQNGIGDLRIEAFKGLELYVWKDENGTLNYNLLPGTDARKTESAIYDYGGFTVTDDIYNIGKLLTAYQEDTTLFVLLMEGVTIEDFDPQAEILEDFMPANSYMGINHHDGQFMNEIVGDSRPLSSDELAYFNDTYFNGATGQNWNLANQFLHSAFADPRDIDLHSLFYLGAGADYAMDDFGGEYDAVAKAYGFDSWTEIPTDVTPIPKASMDDMLEQYTGIDLLATNKVGLESFKYLEQYDCYYNLHGDTNYYGDVEFVWGRQMGTQVSLSYHNSWQQADYILTLVDDGGGNYKIKSNIPASIEE